MKLTLTRGGGLAGLRKPPVELDTAALAADARDRVYAMVDAAPLASTPETAGADQLGYTLTITDDDGAMRTTELTMADAPPALRALIGEIRRLAGERGR
jgi:hypothetical protein